MMANQEQKQEQVFEIAIVGRVVWNLHSLNNEGTIGNVTEPRTVVLWDGTKTDGVSGEMMKHIHAFWTWLQARENNLPLCQACKEFKPERANADRRLRREVWKEVLEEPKNERPKVAVNKAIVECAICDLHGFLIAQRVEGEEGRGRRGRSQEDKFPAVHRTSVIEFGWVVGIPQKFHRDLHLHARHSQEEQTREEDEGTREGEERVTVQMLYHRPTRSGVYAFVTLFQAWRIGLNEVNYTYALNDENERKKRYELALTAYEWTFKRPDGAMTTTRLPHIEGAEGLVLVAKTAVPVPLLSPLRENYRQQLKDLAQKQGVEVYEFDDLGELTDILTGLRQLNPFKLSAASQQ
jgi:CRISPR-associated protein Cst2